MAKNMKNNNLRIPPQSIPSEQAVLGSIMLRKDAMHEIEGIISPDSFYVEKHKADIVQKKYVLRSLIEAADYVSELAFSESEDHMDEILDMAEKKVFSVVSSPKNQKFINLKDALPEAWERLEKLHEHKGMLRGLATGFRDLDNILSGFQKSDLIILAARPSMGKTTLALDIARMTSVVHEKSVLVFSLEMSSQQLVDRMLSAQSRVNAWNLRTGHLSSD